MWIANPDLSITIFSYLDSKELLHISAVSTYWREFSSTQNLWRPLVEELWKDKVYIHPRIRQLANINAKLAFYISIADSKRYFMTHEEVISFTFSFRFKEAAGAEWTDLCPWNDGEEASKVSFNADGTAHRIPSDRLDSTRHMALEAMYSGFRMNWVLRRRQRSLRKNSRLLFYFALQQLVEACLTQGRNAIYFGCHRLHNDSFVEPAFTTGLPSDLTPSPKLKQPRTSNMHTPSSQYRRRRASEEVGCLSSQSEFNWLTVFSHYASAASPSDDFLHTIGENLQLLVRVYL